MKNISKDKIIELLKSKDKELRELGLSYILNNYKFPEIVYCDSCLSLSYDFNLKEGKFKYKDNHILGILENQVKYEYWLENYELNNLLDVIITYNE